MFQTIFPIEISSTGKELYVLALWIKKKKSNTLWKTQVKLGWTIVKSSVTCFPSAFFDIFSLSPYFLITSGQYVLCSCQGLHSLRNTQINSFKCWRSPPHLKIICYNLHFPSETSWLNRIHIFLILIHKFKHLQFFTIFHKWISIVPLIYSIIQPPPHFPYFYIMPPETGTHGYQNLLF